jgi:hypothetical protein
MTERVKRPAFQWYPGDWRRDVALQSCSIEARGLWMEMINLMHDGDPYGHLSAGGITIDAVMLANLTGIPAARVKKLIAELEQRRIFSRTDGGVIYSRRMVRDEALRTKRAEYGKLGGNPNLTGKSKHGDEGNEDKGKVAGKVNPNPTPATATASLQFASAEKPLSAAYAQACAIRANQGLAEHATRPQPIARVIATNGSSHAAAEALIAANVPLAFAESTVYELAKAHAAQDQITSLKYFVPGVIRAWEREGATSDASDAQRPSSKKKRSGDPTYDALQDLIDAEKAKTAVGGSRG